MPLLIDTASSARRLTSDQFQRWAQDRAVFVSSVMDEFMSERALVADALRDLGLRPILFEELGGRDDNAEQAFLSGVDQSDIYVGVMDGD